MNTIKNIEVVGRRAWLAGIGAYGTGWKYAMEKFDETYVKTNELLSDFIVEGEKIEKSLQEQLKSKVMIEARVVELKDKLGLNELSEADRLDALSLKVDNLTASVANLVKAKQATAAPKKAPAAKKAPAKKTVAKKTTAKA
ncbi:MAG: hypothetical protein KJO69_02005 [Gammaproteobacteria bacterium]|nr:hypothetical protein [Gammaproteobacteria bacterium]